MPANRPAPEWDHEPTMAEMEAENPADYRHIALRFLWIMNHILSLMPKQSPERWAIMFAIGHPECMGKSMSEVAATLGCSKAYISTVATNFLRNTGLPPSPYMRKMETTKINRESRLAYVRAKQNDKRRAP
jgi:hypothetical protein